MTSDPQKPLRILFLEDNPNDAEMARRQLYKEKIVFDHETVETEADFRRALRDFVPDLIVSDYVMPAFDGMRALEIARSHPERIPFIVLTGSINEETAVACLKAGADDYVLKEKLTRLPFAVREVLEKHEELQGRMRAEEKLRRSEEKFRLMADNAIDCIWQLDESLRFTYLSPSLFRIMGYTPGEWIGTHISDHSTPEEAKNIARIGIEAIRNPEEHAQISFETWMRHKNGDLVPLEIVGKPLFINGEPAGLQGSTRDIRERKKAETALRESEKRFRDLAEMLPIVIFEMDLDGGIIYANREAHDIFGYAPEELSAGLNAFELLVAEDRPLARENFARRLNGEDLGTVKYTGLTKNGHAFPALVEVNPIQENGYPKGFRGIVVDLSEEMEMIDRLSASQKRFQVLFEFAPDGYFLIDFDGKIIDANRQAQNLLQQNHDELVGKSMLSKFRLRGKTRQRALELLSRNAAGHPTEREEFALTRPDKSRLVAEISTYPVKIGKESLILGIARDITQAKALQDELTQHRNTLEKIVEERTRELHSALRESEANRDRIDTILKSVSDGLLVTDTNGHIILMNARAEDYLGVRFSESINRNVSDAIKQEPLARLIHKALSGSSGNLNVDIESAPVGAETRILEAAAKPISIQGRELIGVLTTFRDVTREREIDRMKTEFLSTTAHELRTPLTSIQGFSEILLTRRELKEEDRKKFLGYINRQAINLANIINDLLDISRIESGAGFALKRAPCDLNEIISRRVELFRISHEKCRFITNLETIDRPVFADGEKIDQVMANLLSNGVRYSPPNGKIRISTTADDNDFQVTVSDQGIGMTKEQVRNMFDKFYRADTSDTAPPGTGLGMSIVKLIIDKHHGRIRVNSRPGEGTSVVFTIPMDPEKED